MLPGAWSALRNTRPCAGLIHSGAGAKSVNVDFCAGCSLAPNWLVLGPPSSARHLWVPSLVRSKNTALSSLDPWASLPSLPLSRRRCRFRRPCSRSSFRLGDGVSGFHVIAGRRARGDQEGDWLWVRVGGGNVAGRLWLVSEPRTAVVEVWSCGAWAAPALELCGPSDCRGPGQPPALELCGRGLEPWAQAPVGLSFPLKTESTHHPQSTGTALFSSSCSWKRPPPPTPLLYPTLHQPRIQEPWMDPVENILRSCDGSGQALKATVDYEKSQINSFYNCKNKFRKQDHIARLWKTWPSDRRPLKNQGSESVRLLSFWTCGDNTDTVTISFCLHWRRLLF